MRNKMIYRAAVGGVLSIFGVQAAHAAPGLFTSAGVAGEAWDLSTTDWGPQGVDTGTAWTNTGIAATFEGTAGTVTLGVPITASSLNFTTSGYIIAGTAANPLTLSGSAVDVVASGTATINAVISGSAGLAVNGNGGSGTLILGGANNYTTGTTINGGVLQIGAATNLPSASAVTLSGGGVLNLSSAITLANNITVASGQTGTLGILTTSGLGTITGNYSGVAGTLTIAGGGTAGFNGFNVNSANGPALGAVVTIVQPNSTSTQLNLTSSANQAFFANAKVSFPTNASTSTAFTAGNGTAANLSFGALDGGLSSTNTGAYAGTTIGFDNRTGTVTIVGTVDGNFSGTIFNGNGSAGAASVIKNGASTQTFSGTNSYTGGTTLNGGVLQIGAAANLPAGSALTFAGGSLNMTAGMTLANNVTIASGQTGTLKMANAGTTLSGNYSNVAGTLVLDMTACTGFNGFLPTSNNGPTGTVSVLAAGQSQLGGAGTNFFASAILSLPATGLVYMNGTTTSWTFGALAGGSSNTKIGFDNNSGKTITINGIANASFAGTIFNGAGTSGANNLVKTGSSTQIFTGNNTYTGTTTISGGTLQVDGSLAAGSAVTVGNAAGQTTALLSGTGTVNGTVTLPTYVSGSVPHLAPGDAGVGTLKMANTLSIGNSGDVLDYLLNKPTASDSLAANSRVTGVTTLTLGAFSSGTANVLNVTPGPNFAVGHYDLIVYTTSIVGAGNQSAWTVNGLAGDTYTLQTGVDTQNSNVTALYLDVTAVPEPAALGLLAVGGLGLLARRRRVR